MKSISSFSIGDEEVNINDTEMTLYDESSIYDYFNSLGIGNLISESTYSQDDGHKKVTLNQNSLFGDGKNKAVICNVFDNGFCYGVGGFDGVATALNGNGVINISGYANIPKPNLGGIYISALNNAIDVRDGNLTTRIYDNATVFRCVSAYYHYYILVMDDGFYIVSLNTVISIGHLNSNEIIYIHGTEGDKNKLYFISSSTYTIGGRVTDYYDNVVGGVMILMYDKKNFALRRTATSDEYGIYSATISGTVNDELFMVFLSPEGVPFQSKVIDTVILT